MKTDAKYFNLRFIKKEKLARDVYRFYFDRVASNATGTFDGAVKLDSKERLEFLAGQYIHLYLPIESEKGRGNSRMFTISSSPLELDYIFITTRILQSLFKKTLYVLKPGTYVKFYGPSGSLILDELKKPSYVFLAGGIGITPFRSMIKYIDQKKLNIKVTLFASFATLDDMIFYEELIGIAKNNPNIKVIYTITNLEGLTNKWKGEKGRISEDLIKKYIKNVQKPIYYITGPSQMVYSMEEIVDNMGVHIDNIFIENFVGY